jgi:hypothetical protein
MIGIRFVLTPEMLRILVLVNPNIVRLNIVRLIDEILIQANTNLHINAHNEGVVVVYEVIASDRKPSKQLAVFYSQILTNLLLTLDNMGAEYTYNSESLDDQIIFNIKV